MSVVLLKQEVDSPITYGEADGNLCGHGESGCLGHPPGGISGQLLAGMELWGFRRGFPVACKEMDYN